MTTVQRPSALTVDLHDTAAAAERPRLAARHLPAWLEAIFASSTRQRILATVVALAVLALTGWLGFRGVVASVEASREVYLRALVDAKSEVLQVWIDSKRQEVDLWAHLPEVRSAAQDLAALAAGADRPQGTAHADIAALLARAPAQQRLLALGRATRGADPERDAIRLVARDGLLLGSSNAAHIGRAVDVDVGAELMPVFEGGTRLLRLRPGSPENNGDATVSGAGLVLWFAAPVRDDHGGVIAALAIATRIDARLGRLLAPGAATAAAGDPDRFAMTDAYAFDRRGVLLATEAGGTAADPSQPPATTRLVQAAIGEAATPAESTPSEADGVLVQPFRNAVGREVIGAWRWLPGEHIGVAVEVDPDAAYSPTQYVRLALQVFFGMLVVAVAVSLGSTLSLAGLLREGRRLGPYRLEGVIEEGGMATVHRAVHALMKRPTAVKILKPHLATDELIARFQREVMLTSRLEHPATVEIYDYGLTRDGTFYFAMEYVDGLTLERLVERDGPQPPARVAHILKQVCESLREAHAKGLVHRDVKPPNIMLCERGGESDVVKVLDWGLIKDVRTLEQRNLTQYARVLGTPDYMPPERVRNPAQADPRVDIYGVGAVAYFLLTGRRLFDAPSAFDLQRMIVEAEAPRAASGGQPVPPSLDELVARCLAKDPATRPQSVAELITVFTEILRVDPWTPQQAVAWWTAHRNDGAGPRTAASQAPAAPAGSDDARA